MADLGRRMAGRRRPGAQLARLFMGRGSTNASLAGNALRSFAGFQMHARLKLGEGLLEQIRADLARPHPVAHERVGFLTAGATVEGFSRLLLCARDYRPVDDDDYLPSSDPMVGVTIGSSAMRKAVQAAYRPPAAILHVHTHGRRGRPMFSRVDLEGAAQFIPSFFGPIPRMPHGMLLLSDNSARALIWTAAHQAPIMVTDIVTIGRSISKFGDLQ